MFIIITHLYCLVVLTSEGMTTQTISELSFWRSLGPVSRLKKLAIATLVVFLVLCLYSVQFHTKLEVNVEKIKDLVSITNTYQTQPVVQIQPQEYHGDVVTRKENFMFIKTYKCGTSSLVNVFYLLGVRRRLNFVIQRGGRAHTLDLEEAKKTRSLQSAYTLNVL